MLSIILCKFKFNHIFMYVEKHNLELCFGNTSRLFLKFTYTQDNMLNCGTLLNSIASTWSHDNPTDLIYAAQSAV